MSDKNINTHPPFPDEKPREWWARVDGRPKWDSLTNDEKVSIRMSVERKQP